MHSGRRLQMEGGADDPPELDPLGHPVDHEAVQRFARIEEHEIPAVLEPVNVDGPRPESGGESRTVLGGRDDERGIAGRESFREETGDDSR